MTPLTDSDADEDQAWRRNETAISTLASSYHLPVQKVAQIYNSELTKLQGGAKITDYIGMLAIKHVKDILRHSPH